MSVRNGLRGKGVRKEHVPAKPFVFWLNQTLTGYMKEAEFGSVGRTPTGARKRLAQHLAISDRALYRYLRSLNSYNRPTDSFIRERVEAMLREAGIGFYEVYPDLEPEVELEPDAWCRQCGEFTAPIESACPWCESKIDPGQVAA